MYIYVYVCCICCFKCCLWMCNVSCIYHVSSVPSFLLYSKYAWGQSFWSFIHRFLVMSQTPPFRAPLFLHRNEPCSVIQSCDVDDMLRRTTRCTPTTNEPCHTSDHSHRLASTTHGGMHLSRGPHWCVEFTSKDDSDDVSLGRHFEDIFPIQIFMFHNHQEGRGFYSSKTCTLSDLSVNLGSDSQNPDVWMLKRVVSIKGVDGGKRLSIFGWAPKLDFRKKKGDKMNFKRIHQKKGIAGCLSYNCRQCSWIHV